MQAPWLVVLVEAFGTTQAFASQCEGGAVPPKLEDSSATLFIPGGDILLRKKIVVTAAGSTSAFLPRIRAIPVVSRYVLRRAALQDGVVCLAELALRPVRRTCSISHLWPPDRQENHSVAASAGWAKAPTGPREGRSDDRLRAGHKRSSGEASGQFLRVPGMGGVIALREEVDSGWCHCRIAAQLTILVQSSDAPRGPQLGDLR